MNASLTPCILHLVSCIRLVLIKILNAMKFVADVMLGRLVRFMRFAGYDVEYDTNARDNDLLHRSRYRTLLTRGRELAARAAKRKV